VDLPQAGPYSKHRTGLLFGVGLQTRPGQLSKVGAAAACSRGDTFAGDVARKQHAIVFPRLNFAPAPSGFGI